MRVKLRNFTTPNFAVMEMPPGQRGDGFVQAPSFRLSLLEPEELADLCDRFRAEVFKKAGKSDPRHTAQVAREGR